MRPWRRPGERASYNLIITPRHTKIKRKETWTDSAVFPRIREVSKPIFLEFKQFQGVRPTQPISNVESIRGDFNWLVVTYATA
jgi:hypothetical protein